MLPRCTLHILFQSQQIQFCSLASSSHRRTLGKMIDTLILHTYIMVLKIIFAGMIAWELMANECSIPKTQGKVMGECSWKNLESNQLSSKWISLHLKLQTREETEISSLDFQRLLIMSLRTKMIKGWVKKEGLSSSWLAAATTLLTATHSSSNLKQIHALSLSKILSLRIDLTRLYLSKGQFSILKLQKRSSVLLRAVRRPKLVKYANCKGSSALNTHRASRFHASTRLSIQGCLSKTTFQPLITLTLP